jgi:hypothetical protein
MIKRRKTGGIDTIKKNAAAPAWLKSSFLTNKLTDRLIFCRNT